MPENRKYRTNNNGKEQILAMPQKAEADQGGEIDLVELFYRLLSAWKLILCLALVFAIVMAAYTTYMVTPMYKATSIIYVLNRSDSVINMADLQIGSALTSDYVKVFSMWEVHERVISKLNLPYSYSQMRSMLSVTNAANTRMLDITIQSPNPAEAAMIANAYAEVVCEYIAETMMTDKPSIMSVALPPANPVSPSKTRNVMMGFVLGAVIGAAIVVLQMLMDDKYKTVDDIRKYTGLPTLATIPDDEVVSKTRKAMRKSGKEKQA